MNGSSAYFASGLVAVLSTRLIKGDKIVRLSNCVDLSSAYKLLQEFGYASFSKLDSPDFEPLLMQEMAQTIAFLNKYTMVTELTNIFVTFYDFLNIKLLVKSKKLDKDLSSSCLTFGSIEVKELFNAIAKQDYSSLPQFAQDLLNEYDKTELAPYEIDLIADKAMYKHFLSLAKKSNNKEMLDYVKVDIDLTNIMSSYRSLNANFTAEFTRQFFIEGGNLLLQDLSFDTLTSLTNSFDVKDYELFGKFNRSVYLPLCKLCLKICQEKTSFAQAETYVDSYKKKFLQPYSSVNNSVMPLIYYYLAKQAEISNVRIILSCIKNKIDKELIKTRLKDIYV
ncbi:MAG: V-type ATPase subunit [Clostridia bacterium]